MKYWINTVSRDHVMIGKREEIVQANHGKEGPMKRLNPGDKVLFYSPKTSFDGGEPLKAFTAVATIADGDVYQVALSDSFKPYRRNAVYEDCTEVNIQPLVDMLGFIKNKKSWGYMFRFGLFEIDRNDFELIYSKMKRPMG